MNRDLTAGRCKAHNLFDQLWKDGSQTRSEAYSWLAGKLGLCKSACHMAKFNQEECVKVQRIVIQEFIDREERELEDL